MIHLTHTGYYAGKTYCGASRDGSAEYAHQSRALENPEYRARVCPDCLKVYAMEAYDEGEDMPEWVRELRND